MPELARHWFTHELVSPCRGSRQKLNIKLELLRVHVLLDSRLLPPVDDGVAELAQQQRVLNDGEVIGKLALDVPDLFRLTHFNLKNKRIERSG